MVKRTHEHRDAVPLTDSQYLEKIDQLFAYNVREHIDLPQLVVVGDQSSGKSSVLEGLTGLAFPRDSGLCTRFATQIIFRRDRSLDKRSVSASIIPASKSDPVTKDKLSRWSAAGLETLARDGFSNMMVEAHKEMSLSTQTNDGLPAFSNHVLRLEIRGPEEDHLSVIDVPGIFKNTTPGKTTKADMELVRDMVSDYMRNDRSVMLAVVPANVDIATQEIIEMAREVDPDEKRTLRIFTKPDLVDKGAENKVIDLIENSKDKLGWVVVRSLGQQEMEEGKDRDREEAKWHTKSPWDQISPENWGIKSLRTRLRELLISMARESYTSIRAELYKKLVKAKKNLEGLGVEPETPEQQRRLLLGIVGKFQDTTRRALSTNYGSSDIFEKLELRLTTRVMDRSIKFSEDINMMGHKFKYTGEEVELEQALLTTSSAYTKDTEATGMTRKLSFAKRTGISEILHPGVRLVPPEEGMNSYLDKEYHHSRGFELGTFNPDLLATLMKTQSEKWTDFSRGYISDIIVIVHQFICSALRDACLDAALCSGILSLLEDNLLSQYRRSIEHLEFLLKSEREGTPMTMNSYLNDNLDKCRQTRMRNHLKGRAIPTHHGEMVRLTDITLQNNMTNTQHMIQDIHDILKSYYNVASKRFIDNVCIQAAGFHLVTGDQVPMSFLTPEWVNDLSTDKLEELAGEQPSVKRRRVQLRKEIQDLEKGREVVS